MLSHAIAAKVYTSTVGTLCSTQYMLHTMQFITFYME